MTIVMSESCFVRVVDGCDTFTLLCIYGIFNVFQHMAGGLDYLPQKGDICMILAANLPPAIFSEVQLVLTLPPSQTLFHHGVSQKFTKNLKFFK